MDLNNIRVNYKKFRIDFDNLEKNPIKLFLLWLNDALKVSPNEANAFVLSTISSNNIPDSRVVLLKDMINNEFVFFTNYNSTKANDIKNNNNVSLNFYWPELERQVRIIGNAQKISQYDSDVYFNKRPRNSRLNAIISNQSSPIPIDYNFEDSVNLFEIKNKGSKICRPKNWGGYSVRPSKIEFWQGRPSRFHDRLEYEFVANSWVIKRLSP